MGIESKIKEKFRCLKLFISVEKTPTSSGGE
ncbi:hypothetical protein RUMOBE_04128 [Blautia obeum ATCC 29174]|jgi:hypothetical protein|uniref:Uncharacterized protein n=1 Tax=Blautia obeum ATCC 29174 TaxID=411459 RepID=A5ZYL1_9FIRM|nr:hypothetical protein RUMOBE_04128 [Blautia obeum ATCC 29174]